MKVLRTTAVLLAFALGACGGGGSDDDVETAGNSESQTTTSAAATPESDIPKFANEFERVCTTQVGFKGVAAFEGGPGVHPIVLFNDHRGEGFVETSLDLPAGWKVEQDTNFEDNTELQAAQLVGCIDRVEEIPTGIMCELESEGEKVTLELVDANYDVKVYAASTGELKHEQRVEARDSECPYFASFQKGDTTFVHQPTDDHIINALKPVVAPA